MSIVEFIATALEEGGATFDPFFGKEMPGKGYMVSIGCESVCEQLTIKSVIEAIKEQQSDVLLSGGFIGAWKYDDDWIIDTSIHVDNFYVAKIIAKVHNQRAIYDIANKKSIDV
jgi:hypothetical protein